MSRPFIKWTGGKQYLVDELAKRVPDDYQLYWEPFLGGGSLFFELNPHRAFLSDINFKLITTYNVVKKKLPELIEDLKTHTYNKTYYYKARKEFNSANLKDVRLASLFIFLNKTCFNGLYRENKKGDFNSPIGRYTEPNWQDSPTLSACSHVLKGATLNTWSFEKLVPLVQAKNFYYLDPPYYDTFSNYEKTGFGGREHRLLFDLCVEIHEKGGYFMLSNSNTEFVLSLYDQFNIEEIENKRSGSGKSKGRGLETELLIRNYG